MTYRDAGFKMEFSLLRVYAIGVSWRES